MWTFLGVATFTYLYKKSNVFLALAPKELALAAVFLAAGLLLSYISFFHGHRLSLSHVVSVPLHFLSFLPLFNHLVPQRATLESNRVDKLKKVSKN